VTEFVLFGGKGGVGKTTLAAATGLKTAREGVRTLVVSTDPAHSIADAYDSPVGETPTRVTETSDLYALEIDPRERFRERYGDTFGDLIEDVQSFGIDVSEEDVGAVAERGMVPGADEVAVLDLFAEYDDHPNWEVVVFDTAPTGHTLRLLTLPDVMNTTVGRLISLKGQLDSVTSTLGSLVGRGGDSEKTSYSERMETLEAITERVGERLRDAERTEFRAVTLAERMAIAETERLLGELDDGEIHVDRVLVNKVLQDASEDCPTCWPRYQDQLDIIETLEADLGVPIQEVPLVADKHGLDRVEAVADYVDAAAPDRDT
jgi:arsenite-transporting ATPase